MAVAAILCGWFTVVGAAGNAQLFQAEPSPPAKPGLPRVLERYWPARVHARLAENRVCALPNNRYDDPKSPYRPLNERLLKTERLINQRYPGALNTAGRPYVMPPPQSLCDDPAAARDALGKFRLALNALEAALAE